MSANPSIIIHGGAGSPSEIDRSYPEIPFLQSALDDAWRALEQGESGERVVVEALRRLEECEYFDAGYGSFPNEHGEVFMDVALMRGNGDFSSLLNLYGFRYPSEIAFDLWQDRPCMMRVATPGLLSRLRNAAPEVRQRYGMVNDPGDLVSPYAVRHCEEVRARRATKGGTVGCVVRDSHGRIFAGTSTGGTALKPDGRIGDSPIVGAGVFTDDTLGGLSSTGNGEAILKSNVVGAIITRMRKTTSSDRSSGVERDLSLEEVVAEELSRMKDRYPEGEAGIIVMPRIGEPVYCYTSRLLYVGHRTVTAPGQVKEEVRVAHR